jgi:BMFP domain-containing protein YqiC
MSEWIKPMTPLQVAQAEVDRLQKCEDDYRRQLASRLTEIEALRAKVVELEARLAPYVSPESEPGMGPTETDRGCLVRMYNRMRDAESERDALRAKVAELEKQEALAVSILKHASSGGLTCTPAERRVLEAVALIKTEHIRAFINQEYVSAQEMLEAHWASCRWGEAELARREEEQS